MDPFRVGNNAAPLKPRQVGTNLELLIPRWKQRGPVVEESPDSRRGNNAASLKLFGCHSWKLPAIGNNAAPLKPADRLKTNHSALETTRPR